MLLKRPFNVDDEGDKDRVMVHQPWSFNKSLSVLQEFDKNLSPEKVNYEWCPLWVHIHDLPLALMNEHLGIVIGESLGEVEEVEFGDNSTSEGSTFWRCTVKTGVPGVAEEQDHSFYNGQRVMRLGRRDEMASNFGDHEEDVGNKGVTETQLVTNVNHADKRSHVMSLKLRKNHVF
ncbi:hypothetical protein PTKIN_Ptkin14bG0087200 [Pterospermum kingtungense]